MTNLLQLLLEELNAGRAAALATVVFQEGSAPRGSGSRLLAGTRGLIAGTTGGGLAEAKALEACARACQSGKPELLDIAMDGTLAAHSDLICGGRVRILIEPFLPSSADQEIIRQALQEMQEEGCFILRPMPPHQGSWLAVPRSGGSRQEALGAILGQMPEREDAAIIMLEGIPFFCERCQAEERMFIAGGGHVSMPTAAIAAIAGFSVHVFDDRSEFASRQRFPHASVHAVPGYENCFAPFHVASRDYIVIVTRGHLFDRMVAAQALKTNAGYIGMIGSQSKKRQVYARLLEEGFSEQDLARIHSPIGLSIGAETPEEIAVSILAECIAHRRGKTVASGWNG